MVPEAQNVANEPNPWNGTGPQTAEGKRRSSRTALNHGMTAESLALLHEAPAALAEHLEVWRAATRRTLLDSGAAGVLAELGMESGDVSDLVGYLGTHLFHTPYRQRLAEGRSIGSGMVEGSCNTAIVRRRQQTGARWRVRRLERKAAL
jgi:hypothetical protein